MSQNPPQEKHGNNALTRASVFHHWGCGFGVRNGHNTLYFAMIYASLTIIIVVIDQVNIEKTFCNISAFAFARKALIFYSALLCLSSAAEIRFEELAQLLHIFMLMLETELPFWPTVLNSSTMLLPLPHPPVEHKRHKRASMCKMSYLGKFVFDSRSNPSDFWISCILSCCDVP